MANFNFNKRLEISVGILLISFLISYPNLTVAEDAVSNPNLTVASNATDCPRLGEECSNSTKKCCIGTCIKLTCSDGISISMGSVRGLVEDNSPSEAIAGELSTWLNIDVTTHENFKELPSLSECGFSSIAKKESRRRKRIVGGNAVDAGSYPWTVQLYLHNISFGNAYFHCGGTLINKRHVLTAAHCLTRIPTATTLKAVTIGNIDRRQSFECDIDNSTCTNSTTYLIEEIMVHENYSEGNVRHDLGIIRLNRDVEYTVFARPICLPLNEKMFSLWKDGKVTVVGWGTQNKAADGKPKVISWKEQEVENILVSRDNCNRFFSRVTGKIQRSQLCAGGYPGKGDCQGDSGGPAFKKLPALTENGTGERYYQFGIVSTGAVIECGKQGKPSVYTSVMFYMNWILDNLVPRPKITLCANCTTRQKVNPKDELSTGLQIDVTDHPKVNLLPNTSICGPPPAILPNAVAGGSVRVKRVIGGRPFGLGSLAWMAQIYVRDSITLDLHLRCSGFIISSRYVMTAGHCVTEISAPFALDSIVLGNYNRLQVKECQEEECYDRKFIPIEDVIVHEYFAKYTHENDIALIRLPEEIKFGRFLQPICLPLSEDLISQWTDRRYTAAGWGRVASESAEFSTSNILHAVNVTLQSRKDCDFVYSRQTGILDSSRICGGGEPGKGECTGDSGGPMMRWVTTPDGNGTRRRYVAFGIASFVECGQQGTPGIYSNILFHMHWILKNMEP